MMRKRIRGEFTVFFLVALAISGIRSEAEPRIAYRVESLPENPAVGEVARIVLVVEGLSPAGLEVSDPDLDEGLALEAKSLRPRVPDPASASREIEVVLELRVLSAGRRLVGGMDIRGKEGKLRVAPLHFFARGPGDAQNDSPAWRWSAPSFVRRFEAFELSLERVDGHAPPHDVIASFSPPAGMSLEPCGPLSWSAIVLEGGEVELPRASIASAGTSIGRASPSAIRIRPLPEKLEPSRAIGRFSLVLEGPPGASLEAGKQYLARLVLSGRGNQPAIRLPEPKISIDAEILPPQSVVLRRVDSSRPVGGAYEGELALEILFTPHRSGALLIEFDDMPFLGAEGDLSKLSVSALRRTVRPSSALEGAGKDGRSSPFDQAIAKLAAKLGAAEPELSQLPSLVAEARAARDPAVRARAYSRGLSLIQRGDGPRRDPEERLLEAGLLWETGDRGKSLALLYGVLRYAPSTKGANEIAAACSGELGSGPPLLDALPPPAPFAAVAGFFVLLSLGLFLASRRRPRAAAGGAAWGRGTVPGKPVAVKSSAFANKRSVRSAAAVSALILSLATTSLALISAEERRERYAIIWADRLFLVPSSQAEGSLPVTRGAAAKLRGQPSMRTPGSDREFVGVRLADGVGGWIRRDELYFY
jgi:hypothetical protein